VAGNRTNTPNYGNSQFSFALYDLDDRRKWNKVITKPSSSAMRLRRSSPTLSHTFSTLLVKPHRICLFSRLPKQKHHCTVMVLNVQVIAYSDILENDG